MKASKVSGYPEYKEDPDEEEEESVAEKRKPSDMGVVKLDFPCALATACDDTSLLSQALGAVEVKWVGMSSVGDYLVRVLDSFISHSELMCISCNPALHYFLKSLSLCMYDNTVLLHSFSSSEKTSIFLLL